MIRYIEPKAIDSYWPMVGGYIDAAIDEELELSDVYEKLMNETMALLVVSDNGIQAACVVEFIDYPKINAMRVVALGGENMKKWLSQLVEFLDTWAVDQKIDRIEQCGRHGWMRVLNEYGYKSRYTFMTKEISYG
jgi:hypothetical protein